MYFNKRCNINQTIFENKESTAPVKHAEKENKSNKSAEKRKMFINDYWCSQKKRKDQFTIRKLCENVELSSTGNVFRNNNRNEENIQKTKSIHRFSGKYVSDSIFSSNQDNLHANLSLPYTKDAVRISSENENNINKTGSNNSFSNERVSAAVFSSNQENLCEKLTFSTGGPFRYNNENEINIQKLTRNHVFSNKHSSATIYSSSQENYCALPSTCNPLKDKNENKKNIQNTSNQGVLNKCFPARMLSSSQENLYTTLPSTNKALRNKNENTKSNYCFSSAAIFSNHQKNVHDKVSESYAFRNNNENKTNINNVESNYGLSNKHVAIFSSGQENSCANITLPSTNNPLRNEDEKITQNSDSIESLSNKCLAAEMFLSSQESLLTKFALSKINALTNNKNKINAAKAKSNSYGFTNKQGSAAILSNSQGDFCAKMTLQSTNHALRSENKNEINIDNAKSNQCFSNKHGSAAIFSSSQENACTKLTLPFHTLGKNNKGEKSIERTQSSSKKYCAASIFSNSQESLRAKVTLPSTGDLRRNKIENMKKPENKQSYIDKYLATATFSSSQENLCVKLTSPSTGDALTTNIDNEKAKSNSYGFSNNGGSAAILSNSQENFCANTTLPSTRPAFRNNNENEINLENRHGSAAILSSSQENVCTELTLPSTSNAFGKNYDNEKSIQKTQSSCNKYPAAAIFSTNQQNFTTKLTLPSTSNVLRNNNENENIIEKTKNSQGYSNNLALPSASSAFKNNKNEKNIPEMKNNPGFAKQQPVDTICLSSSESEDSPSNSQEELAPWQAKLRDDIDRIVDSTKLQHAATDYTTETVDKGTILRRIEEVLVDIKQRGKISVRSRSCEENFEFLDNRYILKPIGIAKNTLIKLNHKHQQSNFQLIAKLLEKIKSLMESNSYCTKRELFYQNLKEAVPSQRYVDAAIDYISCLLDVGPWEFSILATSKGLVYGNMKVFTSKSESDFINCNAAGGTLIPQVVDDITKIETNAYFILVVEKDSIFQKLLDEDTPNRLTRPFLMITGKGFPDINTRLFLAKLCEFIPIPAFILVDGDPHGIDILLNYKFGSGNLAHLSKKLAVPSLRWLGVFPSEMESLNVKTQPLSDNEKAKVQRMLQRPYMVNIPRIKQELEVLVEKGIKAEIEGLIKCDTFLSSVYLPNKFHSGDYI